MKKSREDLIREANAILRNAGEGKLAIRAPRVPPPASTTPPEMVGDPPLCPRCRGAMVARRRKADGHAFFGCRAYPRCKGTVDGRDYDPDPGADGFDHDF